MRFGVRNFQLRRLAGDGMANDQSPLLRPLSIRQVGPDGYLCAFVNRRSANQGQSKIDLPWREKESWWLIWTLTQICGCSECYNRAQDFCKKAVVEKKRYSDVLFLRTTINSFDFKTRIRRNKIHFPLHVPMVLILICRLIPMF